MSAEPQKACSIHKGMSVDYHHVSLRHNSVTSIVADGGSTLTLMRLNLEILIDNHNLIITASLVQSNTTFVIILFIIYYATGDRFRSIRPSPGQP